MSHPAARLAGVSKAFGGIQAVAGLDLTIRTGELVALLGPNGAGKSTTIAMLLGLLRPDAGEVTLFGLPPKQAIRVGRVGAMPQGGRLPWFATVGELVALGRALSPRPLPTAEILAAAGLASLTRRPLQRLSGGEAQRAKFGFALAGDPDLLVLDEPTTGLDVGMRQAFWQTVRRRGAAGRTVLFATHYLAEADEHADRIVMLAAGRVVAEGTSAQLRRAAAGRRVSFHLAGGSVAGLDRLPGVTTVEVRADRAILTTEDTDQTVPALLRTRGPVRDLEVTSGGLTEAFLALTADPPVGTR